MTINSYYNSIWGIEDTKTNEEFAKSPPIAHAEKFRAYTEPIDDEDNVFVFNIDEYVKYLSEYFTGNLLIPMGNVDLVQCGTSKGKTTLFTKKFMKEAFDYNFNIMLILPRKMINLQIVSELSSEKVDFVSDNGVYHIENLTLVSYQKLYSLLKQKKQHNDGTIFGRKYRAIIYDESHTILEDSLFSEAANYILDDIFKYFGTKSSYYFLSATMENAERIIYDHACKLLRRMEYNSLHPKYYYDAPPTFRKFVLHNSYENYNVKYLASENEIVKIYNNLPDNRKLLVFVSSKDIGRRLNEKLEDSIFLFSENDEERLSDEARFEYERIQKNSSFDSKTLITTKLLDAGVNFKMTELRDIVITVEDGMDEFIQIVGRRRNIDDSKVNLYILARDKSYFINRRFSCTQKLKALSDIAYCNNCFENIKKRAEKYGNVFDASGCKNCRKNIKTKYFSDSSSLSLIDRLYTYQGQNIVINPMARKKLIQTADMYDDIIKDFNTIGDHAYILKQLSWLGLENTYSDDNYYSSENIPPDLEDLVNLLCKYSEKELDKAMQEAFRDDFEDIATKLKLYSKRSENIIGLNAIKKIIEENKIQYTIESINSNDGTVWLITKVL